MNIIINDYSTNIGGIETYLYDLAELLSENHNVIFLVDNNDSYYEVNKGSKHYTFIYKKNLYKVEYLSKNSILNERSYIQSHFDENLDYYVISFRYPDLQYALAVFANKHNFKLIHFWSHPMSWISSLYLFGRNNYVTSKISKNRNKFQYQQRLRVHLNENKADYCGLNKAVLHYNNWYYGTNLGFNPNAFNFSTRSKCELQNKDGFNSKVNMIKFVWVGRYEWFKINAINYIIGSLEMMDLNFKDFKISLDLYGYGSLEQERIINDVARNSSIFIRNMGKVEYANLPEILGKYDVGISMGTTVKNMADCSLSCILIDSINNNDITNTACSWFFDTEDDSGDALYLEASGYQLTNRKTLTDLLTPVFKKNMDLNEISIKCKKHFMDNFSMKENLPKLLNLLSRSEFSGLDFEVYRRGFLIRYSYKIYKFLDRTLNKDIAEKLKSIGRKLKI